jgi:hypothetical protein
MTAEQAWDSCATLAVGPAVDHFKAKRAETYAKAMKIDFTASNLEEQIRGALAALRNVGGGVKPGKPGKGKAAMRKRMMKEEDPVEDGEVLTRPPTLGGMVLARASELPQPERDQRAQQGHQQVAHDRKKDPSMGTVQPATQALSSRRTVP